jgi:formate--tetrahydrofolate ligase
MEDVNLHFTGDIHAVGAANNLLAAMLDASILHGNPHSIDTLRIGWRRALDINDRALRQIAIALGGRSNGYPRETGFDITAASEVMAILAVARDLHDLRGRLGAITAAYSFDGAAVTAEDLGAAGAMTVLLKQALKPNLIQTLEGQPCLMHTGPFANIAHGNSSLVADLIGLKLGDYLVTESGFGSDMGMEKLFDIVCRVGGLRPSAVVLVVTVRALKHHGGIGEDDSGVEPDHGVAAIEAGLANLRRHLGIVREFAVPCVVAVNRRPGDLDDELAMVRQRALELGAFAAEINEGFERGGVGAGALAEAVVDACEQPNEFDFIYDSADPIAAKINAVATRVYKAKDVLLAPAAERRIRELESAGLGGLPVCMAKTPLSLSGDPTLLGAPEDFTLHVRDVRAYTGAGWLVPLCGDIQQMPGLGTQPAALNIDIDSEGRTVGLF